jgi:hypothetical protein
LRYATNNIPHMTLQYTSLILIIIFTQQNELHKKEENQDEDEDEDDDNEYDGLYSFRGFPWLNLVELIPLSLAILGYRKCRFGAVPMLLIEQFGSNISSLIGIGEKPNFLYIKSRQNN